MKIEFCVIIFLLIFEFEIIRFGVFRNVESFLCVFMYGFWVNVNKGFVRVSDF